MLIDPLINAMIQGAYEIRLMVTGDADSAFTVARDVCRRMLPHLCEDEVDMTLRSVLTCKVPA